MLPRVSDLGKQNYESYPAFGIPNNLGRQTSIVRPFGELNQELCERNEVSPLCRLSIANLIIASLRKPNAFRVIIFVIR